jgi:uncharacterized protein
MSGYCHECGWDACMCEPSLTQQAKLKNTYPLLYAVTKRRDGSRVLQVFEKQKTAAITLQPEEARALARLLWEDNATPTATPMTYTIQIYRDTALEFRWRIKHRNGHIIAVSSEGYKRKAAAKRALLNVLEAGKRDKLKWEEI